MRRGYASLALFLALVAAVALIAGQYMPGAWYAGLAKPAWTPPNWLFGPVWGVLYVMIAVAGWLVWHVEEASSARWLWLMLLLLNGAWSPIMFGLHQIGWAMAVILFLLTGIGLFIALTWHSARGAALLFVPYFAWVGYASALNVTIWRLNG